MLQVSSNNKRSMTLGPSEPVHDWEVERATVLIECREYRERMEVLERKVEQDQIIYERNTASLIREVKMKETLLERRLEDTENRLLAQIEDLQRRLEKEEQDHEEEVRDLREQYDKTLEAEQNKHGKRLASLQERLTAKDAENSQLSQAIMGGQSELLEMEQLKSELAKERSNREQEKEEWATKASHYKHQLSLAEHAQFNARHSPSTSIDENDEPERLQEKLHYAHQKIANQEAQINSLTSKLSLMKQKHQKKTSRIHETMGDEVERVKELLVYESRMTAMKHEAQVQNLNSEHTETLRELREQFDNEKEVWKIEHQAALDDLKRQMKRDHQNITRELEHTWKDKMADLQSLMSIDSLSNQKHWENKMSEIQDEKESRVNRLQGQIEVIKGRLGNEIDKRRQCQALLEVMKQKEYQDLEQGIIYREQVSRLVKVQKLTEHEIDKLRREQRMANKLARNILGVVGLREANDERVRLPDMLEMVMHHIVLESSGRLASERIMRNDYQ